MVVLFKSPNSLIWRRLLVLSKEAEAVGLLAEKKEFISGGNLAISPLGVKKFRRKSFKFRPFWWITGGKTKYGNGFP